MKRMGEFARRRSADRSGGRSATPRQSSSSSTDFTRGTGFMTTPQCSPPRPPLLWIMLPSVWPSPWPTRALFLWRFRILYRMWAPSTSAPRLHRVVSHGHRLEFERCGCGRSSKFDPLVRAYAAIHVLRVTDAIPRLAWPGDAERRWPSRDPGALRASAGTPSAGGVGGPGCRAAPGGPGPDQRAPRPAAGRRAGGGHPAAGTGACRRAVVRPDSPPRGPRRGASDRGAEVGERGRAALGPVL